MYSIKLMKDQPLLKEAGINMPTVWELARELQEVLSSTYSVTIEPKTLGGRKYVGQIDLSKVRLNEKKGYCGNHPGPCVNGGGAHKNMTYLEGGDWVLFNDSVNDVLDKFNLNASAGSSHCVVRVGLARRTHYGYENSPTVHRNGDWSKRGEPEDYQNWCGEEAPRATAPSSTPALPMEQYA